MCCVSAGTVVLESPTLPVEEGGHVTLRCAYKGRYDVRATSDFNAAFFKDNVFIGNRSDGKMILESVSEKDKGFYKCQHPKEGESPQSPLLVTGEAHWLQSVHTSLQ